MSNVFFTADQHFGHEAVAIKHRGFSSVSDHDDEIIEAWRKRVKPDDRVWVLGDLTLNDPEYGLDIMSDLPGRKILIPGNHDACHPMHRDAWKWQARYYRSFEAVMPFARVRLNGDRALLSHFPYHRDRGLVRHTQWRLRNEGAYLIHGHTHQRDMLDHPGSRELCVSVDASPDWGPVPLGRMNEALRDRGDRKTTEQMIEELRAKLNRA